MDPIAQMLAAAVVALFGALLKEIRDNRRKERALLVELILLSKNMVDACSLLEKRADP